MVSCYSETFAHVIQLSAGLIVHIHVTVLALFSSNVLTSTFLTGQYLYHTTKHYTQEGNNLHFALMNKPLHTKVINSEILYSCQSFVNLTLCSSYYVTKIADPLHNFKRFTIQFFMHRHSSAVSWLAQVWHLNSWSWFIVHLILHLYTSLYICNL